MSSNVAIHAPSPTRQSMTSFTGPTFPLEQMPHPYSASTGFALPAAPFQGSPYYIAIPAPVSPSAGTMDGHNAGFHAPLGYWSGAAPVPVSADPESSQEMPLVLSQQEVLSESQVMDKMRNCLIGTSAGILVACLVSFVLGIVLMGIHSWSSGFEYANFSLIMPPILFLFGLAQIVFAAGGQKNLRHLMPYCSIGFLAFAVIGLIGSLSFLLQEQNGYLTPIFILPVTVLQAVYTWAACKQAKLLKKAEYSHSYAL